MAENGADGGNQLPSALEEALAHATDKATAEAARLARAFATSRSVEEAESDVDGLQPSTTASDQGESDAVEGSAVSTAAGDQADSTLAAAAILTQTLSVRKILQLYRVYSAKRLLDAAADFRFLRAQDMGEVLPPLISQGIPDGELPFLVLFISHRWETAVDPDPEGQQIKAVRDLLNEVARLVTALFTEPDAGAAEAARPCLLTQGVLQAAFVIHSIFVEMLGVEAVTPDAVLSRIAVWYDFGSMPQLPRSPDEEREFQTGLLHLNALAGADCVRVIGLRTRGDDYESRGWCVAEATAARRKKTGSTFGLALPMDELGGEATALAATFDEQKLAPLHAAWRSAQTPVDTAPLVLYKLFCALTLNPFHESFGLGGFASQTFVLMWPMALVDAMRALKAKDVSSRASIELARGGAVGAPLQTPDQQETQPGTQGAVDSDEIEVDMYPLLHARCTEQGLACTEEGDIVFIALMCCGRHWTSTFFPEALQRWVRATHESPKRFDALKLAIRATPPPPTGHDTAAASRVHYPLCVNDLHARFLVDT